MFVLRRLHGSADSLKVRYQFQKTSEQAQSLDEQIEHIAAILQESYSITDFSDPSITTTESVYAVGRILSEPTLNDPELSIKMTESTILLEGTRSSSGGRRVPLQLRSDLIVRDGPQSICPHGLGLFPGMIVAVKGRNGSGDWFGVDEVLLVRPDRYRTCSQLNTMIASSTATCRP